jgi:hypothetical protein
MHVFHQNREYGREICKDVGFSTFGRLNRKVVVFSALLADAVW